MVVERSQWMLFGVDLRSIGALWRQGWQEIANRPQLAKWLPRQRVELECCNGDRVHWHGTSMPLPGDPKAIAAVRALEVPESLVLHRRLRLPRMSASQLASAIALEVETAAPFAPDDIVSGWRMAADDGNRLTCDIVISSRMLIDGWLQQRGPSAAGAQELWCMVDARPVVLGGWREAARQKVERRMLWSQIGLVALAGAFLLLLAALPVLQARQQVFDAQQRYESLRRDTADLVTKREQLVNFQSRQTAVRNWQDNTLELMPVIELLTGLFPDDAHLTGIELRGRTLVLQGLARNAAGLMDALGARAEFSDIKPSGISREPVSGLETFKIELTVRAAGAAGGAA